MKKTLNAGFTLIELMIVIAIVAIIAALAVPSYRDMAERNRLKEAAESLASDMRFARTEAIKKSKDLRLTLVAATWCYGIDDDNTACDCGTPGDCAIKAVDGTQFQGISLDNNNSVTFSFRRGTANAMGATLSSANYQARVMVANVGRVRICTPAGAAGLQGYPTC
jgi:type IV fimbrial biogenesis protein FimT